jgi:hypothetical protein
MDGYKRPDVVEYHAKCLPPLDGIILEEDGRMGIAEVPTCVH